MCVCDSFRVCVGHSLSLARRYHSLFAYAAHKFLNYFVVHKYVDFLRARARAHTCTPLVTRLAYNLSRGAWAHTHALAHSIHTHTQWQTRIFVNSVAFVVVSWSVAVVHITAERKLSTQVRSVCNLSAYRAQNFSWSFNLVRLRPTTISVLTHIIFFIYKKKKKNRIISFCFISIFAT